LTPVYTILIY